MLHTAKLEKLVHGGQALGWLESGKRVFVWNGLPGETVGVRVTRDKKGYAEGLVEEVIVPSKDRIPPKDAAYLSTSPWQIMSVKAERTYKQEILSETIDRSGFDYKGQVGFSDSSRRWHYRNKMEYSFWADESGLHLALYQRGTHKKQIVTGSSIAKPEIDVVAQAILAVLRAHHIRAGQLKTLVLRANQAGEVVAALFVKDQKFPDLSALRDICKGIAVYYSNPKSPASVISRQLKVHGDITLTDTIDAHLTAYDVNSFFQVNLPVFETALTHMKRHLRGAPHQVVDMYAGVGTLVRPLGATKMVEIDAHNVAMARKNLSGYEVEIVHAQAEKSLSHVPAAGGVLAVDPPRAGLHNSLVRSILDNLPAKILYLSCNPITQVRDIAALSEAYDVIDFHGYNFFPASPHIESLAILKAR